MAADSWMVVLAMASRGWVVSLNPKAKKLSDWWVLAVCIGK